MPSIMEQERALKRIRTFSRTYRGVHADFFSQLYEDIRDLPSSQSRERERRVIELYQYAISSLVAQSAPPSRQTLDEVCERFRRVTGSAIADVEIVLPVMDGADDAEGGPRPAPAGTLSKLLPKPRKLDENALRVLQAFREQLPGSNSIFDSTRSIDGRQD